MAPVKPKGFRGGGGLFNERYNLKAGSRRKHHLNGATVLFERFDEDSNPMFTLMPQKLQRSPADISALSEIKITKNKEKLPRFERFEDSNPMFTLMPQKLQRSPADISALSEIKITKNKEKLPRCNIDMSGVGVSTEMDDRLKHVEDCLYLQIIEVLNNVAHTYPTLLPGSKFTEVYVVHRNTNYVSVTPMERKMELFELRNILQVAAVTALPMKTPKEKDKCIAKWCNIWYRGRIVSLEPLRVLFVDNGNTEVCSSENIKELPAHLNKKYSPFAIRINTKDMELDMEIIKKDHFLVKPLYKDSDRGLWVVDVAAVVEATPVPQPPALSETVVTLPSPCATSQPKTNHFSCSFLPEGTFSTVTIVHQNLVAWDQYFVGPTNILEMHNEMNKHFAQMTASGSQLMTPKIGEIGICKFEGIWYRVKVESLAPVLTVFYMDYGNTDATTAEELRECPESHKNIPALVRQIKLGTGISEKFFNLEPFSSISIKPISSLDDGTIVVHVEGETYNTLLNEVSKPLSPAPETKLSQMVSPVFKTAPVQGNETSSVFSSSVGKIIGRGGSKIRELQTDSGADIKVKKITNSNLTEITLRGSKESQAKPKELIHEVLDDSRVRDTNSSFYESLRGDENGGFEEKDCDEVNRQNVTYL